MPVVILHLVVITSCHYISYKEKRVEKSVTAKGERQAKIPTEITRLCKRKRSLEREVSCKVTRLASPRHGKYHREKRRNALKRKQFACKADFSITANIYIYIYIYIYIQPNV